MSTCIQSRGDANSAGSGSVRDCLLRATRIALGSLILLAGGAAPSQAAERSAPVSPSWSEMRLLLCFQGKGSCLPYDAGVLREAFDSMPALGSQQVIVGGNSSGAILAAYFCCFGMSEATVRHAERTLLSGAREAVRMMENPHSKLAKLARGQRTEIPHTVMREYLGFALGVSDWQTAATVWDVADRSAARPRFPVVIVACNKEVLEDAHPLDGNKARGLKTFDMDTQSASWRSEVHAFYRANPATFEREHPDLKLSDDPRIGHAVTLFVDRGMYDLLRRIPPEERQADLRLMEDARDVALAILASTSEPTYFDPIEDPNPEKILAWDEPGDLGNVRRRTYYGGYILALPAQDARRMLPGLRVMGTGWRHNPVLARNLLAGRLLADVEAVAHRAEWWADLEANPDAEFESHMIFRDLTAPQEYEFGRRRARECFGASDNRSGPALEDTATTTVRRESPSGAPGLPRFAVPPRFPTPAASAIWPTYEAPDMLNENGEAARLATMRGLGPLLSESPERKTSAE